MRRRVARGRGCFLYDVPYVGTPDRILAPCGQSAGRAAAQRVSRRAGLGFSLVRCGQSLAAGHSWFQVLQPLAHGPRPGCLVWRQPCRQRTVRKRGLHRSRAASYPAVATIRLPISPRGSLPGWECRWRIGRSVACATTRARRPVLRPGAGRTYATCLRSRGPERWPDGTCCWSMTW